MATNKNDKVHISIDKDFFEQVFEPARRKKQEKLGLINLTQRDFTKILMKENFRFPVNGVKNQMFPQKVKRRRKK